MKTRTKIVAIKKRLITIFLTTSILTTWSTNVFSQAATQNKQTVAIQCMLRNLGFLGDDTVGIFTAATRLALNNYMQSTHQKIALQAHEAATPKRIGEWAAQIEAENPNLNCARPCTKVTKTEFPINSR